MMLFFLICFSIGIWIGYRAGFELVDKIVRIKNSIKMFREAWYKCGGQ